MQGWHAGVYWGSLVFKQAVLHNAGLMTACPIRCLVPPHKAHLGLGTRKLTAALLVHCTRQLSRPHRVFVAQNPVQQQADGVRNHSTQIHEGLHEPSCMCPHRQPMPGAHRLGDDLTCRGTSEVPCQQGLHHHLKVKVDDISTSRLSVVRRHM